jgi:hypothetical protein
MVGDTALARTVVVKNVTEPNPALLHELPRSINSWRALTRQAGPASPSEVGLVKRLKATMSLAESDQT